MKRNSLSNIISFFPAILGQPNYCKNNIPKTVGFRKVRRVHVHPNFRAKKGKGKKNMPIQDFALIEVNREMEFSWRVQQNGGQLFSVVITKGLI